MKTKTVLLAWGVEGLANDLRRSLAAAARLDDAELSRWALSVAVDLAHGLADAVADAVTRSHPVAIAAADLAEVVENAFAMMEDGNEAAPLALNIARKWSGSFIEML